MAKRNEKKLMKAKKVSKLYANARAYVQDPTRKDIPPYIVGLLDELNNAEGETTPDNLQYKHNKVAMLLEHTTDLENTVQRLINMGV